MAAEPENQRVHYYLGSIYVQTQEFPKAVEQLQRIEPASEYYVDARIQLASVYQREDKTPEAIREIERDEEALEQVIAVCPSAVDPEPEVDLCRRAHDERRSVLHLGASTKRSRSS
jgi:lipopolysaccharide biosynthesis regulator YciM